MNAAVQVEIKYRSAILFKKLEHTYPYTRRQL